MRFSISPSLLAKDEEAAQRQRDKEEKTTATKRAAPPTNVPSRARFHALADENVPPSKLASLRAPQPQPELKERYANEPPPSSRATSALLLHNDADGSLDPSFNTAVRRRADYVLHKTGGRRGSHLKPSNGATLLASDLRAMRIN